MYSTTYENSFNIIHKQNTVEFVWICSLFPSKYFTGLKSKFRGLLEELKMIIYLLLQIEDGMCRAMFGLSVIGILVSIFSCMLVYQILR